MTLKLDDAAASRYPMESMSDHEHTPREDTRRTARDLRAVIAFGIIAASVEMGILLYFFR